MTKTLKSDRPSSTSYLLLVIALYVVMQGIGSSSAFASVAQKKTALAKHVTPGTQAVAQLKENRAKTRHVSSKKSKEDKGSQDPDIQKFTSQLKQLVEKGTITQEQANTLTQSLEDISGRLAKAFSKNPRRTSLKSR